MNHTYTALIQEVLSLILMMEESCKDFYRNLVSGDEENCQSLFNDLTAGVSGLYRCYRPLKNRLNNAFYLEMTDNIAETLRETAELINADQNEKAVSLLKYQFYPFLQELLEEIYFWGTIYPDKARMDSYYENEFADRHKNLIFNQEFPKYKISIFIPVYNNLEYTKQCLDSVFKNTCLSHYSYELILLDDGSNDGTAQYLRSLNIKKTIVLKQNVKTLIFSLAFRICEGEYFLFINNDTLLTKGWLDNLITCIESDPAIISATPCTPNTSNLQSDVDGLYTYRTPLEAARHQNHSIPRLWEERARIMPVIALYRTASVNQIGLADRLFYTMEFWDDDFSMRARRAGYKQMLCRDTYCYHFGSVTGKTGQVKENTLEHGRALFRLKNNADAWGHDFCMDVQVLSLIHSEKQSDSISTQPSILGIDCGYGDTIRQIKNHINRQIFSFDKEPRTASLTLAFTKGQGESFVGDTKSLSAQTVFVQNIDELRLQLNNTSLDYICLSRPLDDYEDYLSVIFLAQEKLKKDGVFLCSATNPYYQPYLERLLNLSFPSDRDSAKFINITSLQKKLQPIFSKSVCTASARSDIDTEQFIKIHMNGSRDPSASLLLSSQFLQFYCKK